MKLNMKNIRDISVFLIEILEINLIIHSSDNNPLLKPTAHTAKAAHIPTKNFPMPNKTPENLSHIAPWMIGPTTISCLEGENFENCFDLALTVQNTVGGEVTMEHDVHLELFTEGCVNTSDSNAVTIANSLLTPGDKFQYNVTFDQASFGQETAGYLTCEPQNGIGCSIGQISFCTLVSTYERSTMVAFRGTNFKLRFDLRNSTFFLSNLDIQENSPDNILSSIEDQFDIEACQCTDFTCISSQTLQQDESLVMCIKPTHPNGDTSASISNFNIKMAAGTPGESSYVEYYPVWFGVNGWENDALTNIQVDGDFIMISAPVLAQFFIQNHNELDVTGNAFLKFKTARRFSTTMNQFRLIFSLDALHNVGCLQALLMRFRGNS